MQINTSGRFFWIGGCPSGGKTTLADKLSKANQIPLFHTDDHSFEYGLRVNAIEPDFHKEINLNFVESIITMPDEPWFDVFIAGLRALCSIVLDDVTKLYANDTAIIEGGVLLPEFISEIGLKNQTIFVNPTYEYLCDYLPKQKWVLSILSSLSDDRVKSLFVKRLVYKYNLFREYLIESAEKYDMKTIFTASPNSLDTNFEIVSRHFSLRKE